MRPRLRLRLRLRKRSYACTQTTITTIWTQMATLTLMQPLCIASTIYSATKKRICYSPFPVIDFTYLPVNYLPHYKSIQTKWYKPKQKPSLLYKPLPITTTTMSTLTNRRLSKLLHPCLQIYTNEHLPNILLFFILIF